MALGWMLFNIRIWIRNGIKNPQFGDTTIASLFPIYFLNYPLIIITLYLIFKYLISLIPFISDASLFVVSFLFGLCIDLIWNNLNPFILFLAKSAIENLKKLFAL
jgi:hypothetical protein